MSDQLARERTGTLLFYGCILLLGYLIFLLFQPFLAPLAWAAIFAAFFFRRYKKLEARFGKSTAASFATIGVAIIIVAPCVLTAMAFVQQASESMGRIDLAANSSKGLEAVQRAWSWAQHQGFGRGLGSFQDFVNQASGWLTRVIANSAGVLVKNAVLLLVDLVIMLFALFFFFRDGDALMAKLRRTLPFDPEFRDQCIQDAGELIHASISAGVVVALIQGAIGGLTFGLLGLGAPVFWGVVMAFFALLPLGPWVVWSPVAVWLLITGEVTRGLILIAVGAGVIGLADNILRPMLLSGRTQMNGLLVFISLLGGIATFGLLGLVLGPIIMATFISFIEVYATERRTSR